MASGSANWACRSTIGPNYLKIGSDPAPCSRLRPGSLVGDEISSPIGGRHVGIAFAGAKRLSAQVNDA
jgi:hypothetical protein